MLKVRLNEMTIEWEEILGEPFAIMCYHKIDR